jgi:multiple sugar transport system permease protein
MSALLDRIPDRFFRILAIVVLAFFLLLIIFPLYFMLTTSFKTEREIYSELTWIPRHPTLENYDTVVRAFRIPIYMRNSAIVALSTTGIVLVIATLAAYALTRLRFRGRAGISRGVLFVYLVPGSLMFIPMYLIIIRLRLQNTYLGLIMANMSFSVPFCTWLLMGYLRNISVEMEEAALIDGCTRFTSLYKIVVPLSVPGIVASCIFTFNGVWNEYIFALILAQDESRRMVSVGLTQFYRSDYYMVGPMMAGSLIAMTPVVILYILSQRYVVTGLSAGAVKG